MKSLAPKKSVPKRILAKKSSRSSERPSVSDELMSAYGDMLRARFVDDKTIVLYKQNKCHFQISCAGHEAVQVAAARVLRPGVDWLYPYYRDMALCGALGMTPYEFFLNAMNKAADPCSHGRMMPMHFGSLSLNMPQQSSPTGSQFLQAVGCALSIKLQKLDQVVYVSAGEGACAQGDFHEAVNWAARERLPIMFLVQNNKYAISTHVSEQIAGQSVAKIVAGYENMESMEIDGTDYRESLDIFEKVYQRVRSGKGPVLVEAHLPRLQSHSISDNHLKYRTEKDLAGEKERCPISRLRKYLLKEKLATEPELIELETKVKREVDQAAEEADRAPDCDPAEAADYTFVDPSPACRVVESEANGPENFLVDSLNHALDEELARDPKMVIFGQDVAKGKGGVFTVTAGLTAKHGGNRVFNSQLAESSIVGAAVGMATHGMKPVVEIQFGDYIWTAMNQLRNELAMMLYRSGADFSCPAVVRVPVGGYIHGGCYHSQNIEATFSHFPGVYVLYPSNATDAKGLLKAAIRSSDPVLFLEHKGLYRQVYAKGPEGGPDFLTPIGKAKIVRSGTDATIVTWGALVHKSLGAADALAAEGVSVEVVDLRTIVPCDFETIFESVRKTHRVLIAHEDMVFMGFGAEIASRIADSCFTDLDAPVKRVGMKYAAAVPHSPILEKEVLPQTADVTAALRELVGF